MNRISFFKIILLTFLVWQGPFLATAQVKPLDAELTNYKYPYPVSFYQAKTQNQNLKMAFMDVKPTKSNGKTVVLLHGKNFNGAYWQTTAAALTKEGFRVIIPDQIGFGKSTKPTSFQYTFQTLAHLTKSLLDSLGVKEAAVLGHSMGGMLATRFALMYPEFTQKLVLLNPIGLEDWKRWVPYQPVEKWYAGELKQNYESIKKYQQENYYGGQWEKEYDPWVAVLAGWTEGKDYPLVAWNAALTYDMIFTQPVLYEFDQLKMPTLLVIGQRDRTALGKAMADPEARAKLGNYPALGKETARKIPNSTLIELDQVGHLPHIEAFDRFIQPLISFLKK